MYKEMVPVDIWLTFQSCFHYLLLLYLTLWHCKDRSQDKYQHQHVAVLRLSRAAKILDRQHATFKIHDAGIAAKIQN